VRAVTTCSVPPALRSTFINVAVVVPSIRLLSPSPL
jgi:hypothetical protein